MLGNNGNYGRSEKTMNEDQFDQVIDAILSGKYSWACVLILKFAGYNPLHYIPYRTYIRLVKDNDFFAGNPKQKNPSKDKQKNTKHRHLEIAD